MWDMANRFRIASFFFSFMFISGGSVLHSVLYEAMRDFYGINFGKMTISTDKVLIRAVIFL